MTNTDFLVNSFNTLCPHAWWIGSAPFCYYLHKWLWHCLETWANPWQISQIRAEPYIFFIWLLLKSEKQKHNNNNRNWLQCIYTRRHRELKTSFITRLKKKSKSRSIWDGFRVSHITAQITETAWFYFTNYTSVVRFLFKRTIEINQLQP